MARLATYVYLTDDTFTPRILGPDDDLPAWAIRALAGNPLVWAEAPDLDEVEPEPAPEVEPEPAPEAEPEPEPEVEKPKATRRRAPKKTEAGE